MTFIEIYTRVLPLWPANIQISDSVIIEPKPATKNQLIMPGRGNSFYSKNLSDAWSKARECAGKENKLDQLMLWTFYQLLSKKAQQQIERTEMDLKPADLNKTLLEEQFYNNMVEEEMVEELGKYKRT